MIPVEFPSATVGTPSVYRSVLDDGLTRYPAARAQDDFAMTVMHCDHHLYPLIFSKSSDSPIPVHESTFTPFSKLKYL